MMFSFLRNREWSLRLSLRKRKCYITGESLFLKLCYRGRKTVVYFLNNNKPMFDDVWLSRKQFLNRYSRNEL